MAKTRAKKNKEAAAYAIAAAALKAFFAREAERSLLTANSQTAVALHVTGKVDTDDDGTPDEAIKFKIVGLLTVADDDENGSTRAANPIALAAHLISLLPKTRRRDLCETAKYWDVSGPDTCGDAEAVAVAKMLTNQLKTTAPKSGAVTFKRK